MGYSLLGCIGVYRVGHAEGGDSFPPDIRACHTAHRHIQTWDLNILSQQESHIEYIPVCSDAVLLGG